MADESVYQPTTREVAQRRKDLAPDIHDAFEAFSHQVFAEGALPEKTKQLIAVAVAHVTQCPYCIQGHTKLAKRKGASAKRSWRRSGLRPRCAPAARTRTRQSHCARWVKGFRKRLTRPRARLTTAPARPAR